VRTHQFFSEICFGTLLNRGVPLPVPLTYFPKPSMSAIDGDDDVPSIELLEKCSDQPTVYGWNFGSMQITTTPALKRQRQRKRDFVKRVLSQSNLKDCSCD